MRIQILIPLALYGLVVFSFSVGSFSAFSNPAPLPAETKKVAKKATSKRAPRPQPANKNPTPEKADQSATPLKPNETAKGSTKPKASKATTKKATSKRAPRPQPANKNPTPEKADQSATPLKPNETAKGSTKPKASKATTKKATSKRAPRPQPADTKPTPKKADQTTKDSPSKGATNPTQNNTPTEAPTPKDSLNEKAQENRELVIALSSRFPEVRNMAEESLIHKLNELDSFYIDTERVRDQAFPFEIQRILFDTYSNNLEGNFIAIDTIIVDILKKMGEIGIIDPRLELLLLYQALNDVETKFNKQRKKHALSILYEIPSLHPETQKQALSAFNDQVNSRETRKIAGRIMLRGSSLDVGMALAEHLISPDQSFRKFARDKLEYSINHRRLYPPTLNKVAQSLFHNTNENVTEVDEREKKRAIEQMDTHDRGVQKMIDDKERLQRETGEKTFKKNTARLLRKNISRSSTEAFSTLIKNLDSPHIDKRIAKLAIGVLKKAAQHGWLLEEHQLKLAQIFRSKHAHSLMIGEILKKIPELYPSVRKDLLYWTKDSISSKYQRVAMKILTPSRPNIFKRCFKAFLK